MKALPLGSLLVLVVLASACYNPLVPPDKSILTGKPCAPPCYYYLVPGESTREDVERFVQTLRQSERRSLLITPSSGYGYPQRSYFLWYGARGIIGSTIVNSVNLGKDGRIIDIEITPDFDLHLKAVVDKYGAPDSYIATYSTGDHPTSYRILVYYPQQGLMLALDPSPRYFPEIRADMRVDEITYFAPDDLENYVNARYYDDKEPEASRKIVESIMSKVHLWIDYSVIEVTCEHQGLRITCPQKSN